MENKKKTQNTKIFVNNEHTNQYSGMVVPIFDAQVEEEHGETIIIMAEDDIANIYNNKYAIIGIRLSEQKEEDNDDSYVIYFILHLATDILMYCAWDSDDDDNTITQLRASFDNDSVSLSVHEFTIGGGTEITYATDEQIDALFDDTPTPQMATITFDLTDCHLQINGETISSGYQVPIGQPLEIAVVGDYFDYEWNCMTLTMGGVDIRSLFDVDGNPASIEITSVDGDIYMEIECLDAEQEPEEDVPIESIRYTDGQGNTCIGFGMLEGESVNLWTNLEVLPNDYTDGVEFMSDDDGIIQVDSGGIATATGTAGESTMITISSMENPSISTTIEISINIEDDEEEEE